MINILLGKKRVGLILTAGILLLAGIVPRIEFDGHRFMIV